MAQKSLMKPLMKVIRQPIPYGEPSGAPTTLRGMNLMNILDLARPRSTLYANPTQPDPRKASISHKTNKHH